MTYNDLIDALTATGIPFGEGEWVNAGALKTDYGVYALDGADDLAADNDHSERLLEGTVDLFVRLTPGREQADKVEAAFRGCGVGWRLESIQRERVTGYTHYEWVIRCLPNRG